MLGSDLEENEQPDFLAIEIFEKFLNSHYCSFLSYNEDLHLWNLGSGVFVTYRGKFFVATAGHVLRDLPPDRWILSYGQQLRHRWKQDHPPVLNDKGKLEREREYHDFGNFHFVVDDDLGRDVGLLEVGNVERPKNCKNEFLMVSRAQLAIPTPESRLEVWGECAEIIRENLEDRRKNQITRVGTRLFGSPDAEKNHYILDYQNLDSVELDLKDGVVVGNQEREKPSRHPGGMSGGPVWMYSKERSESGVSVVENPKLIGLQSAVRIVDDRPEKLLVSKLEDWMELADSVID